MCVFHLYSGHKAYNIYAKWTDCGSKSKTHETKKKTEMTFSFLDFRFRSHTNVHPLLFFQSSLFICCIHFYFVLFLSLFNYFLFLLSSVSGTLPLPFADIARAFFIQKMMHSKNSSSHNREKSFELVPCCTATQFSSLQLLYMESNTTVTRKTLPNMVVEACGCM